MQGSKAVEPDCAEIVVEFMVAKVIGKVGGSWTSNGLIVAIVVIIAVVVVVIAVVVVIGVGVVDVLVAIAVAFVIVVPKTFPLPATTTSAITVLVWYSVCISTLSRIDRMRLVT